MSWNEPGSPKKDPWSGRDQQESPPDLEEVLRSLQDRFNRLFGGRGGSGPGGSMGNPGKLVGLAAGGLVLIWILTGIYIVQEGNRGVVTRFGKYAETTMPGPHWHIPAPIESVQIVNVEQQRVTEVGTRVSGRSSQDMASGESLMLTQDENIVDVHLTVQYQIKDAKEYLFSVLAPEATLKQATKSAQRAVIGKSTMDFVLTEGRSEVAEEIKNEVQRMLDDYGTGIRVLSVNLMDAQPPEEVQPAFADAIKAREDEQRLKNEAQSYANEVIPKARGAAARLSEEAEAYKQRVIARAQGEAGRFSRLLAEYEKAPDVTRERLYIETLQDIYSRSNVTLVDVKGGNNMFYLPLDKLRAASAPAVSMAEEDRISQLQDSSDSGARIVRPAARGREGRSQQ
ncbi:FtsH protease activity modulator HflK [Methylolobus aquaticus]|uniref:FtsH protease activity modulator HflK n=1 Tax=Methylotetracoccus oryzae TaxID=1919059 RepID=UPI0011190A79|nr:FtsH protease activity modulator HflK [Methylotetracoccus oryzae]